MIMIRCMAVLCWAALTTAARSDLTKLLSLSARNSDGSVVNVTSASIVIPSYSVRNSRSPQEFQKYAFRPRAMPEAKYKSEVLYPGSYFNIPQKSEEEQTKEVYSQFQPQAIPLREEGRELDDEPEDIADQATRRSLSYIFGGEADEEPDDEDGEYEIEEEDTGEESKSKNKRKKKKNALKNKRYSKYMLPLLLAYKMKYVAIVPVMIGGLVLLAGATGLAGFFFALFAATMALQKGGY
ncbi:uncharacterized protein LOC125054583 [Pieris napi]|uniref:uncharacterized protein LOC125054583 n=1 Tax=Pieris napi TaxID=78633 RepID=UPI001FB8FA0A|nr:uncharacterized protein LOC125054583 [Pieris napi]